MRAFRGLGQWVVAAMLAGLMWVPGAALAADDCQVDADCPEHFVCMMSTVPCPGVVCDPASSEECEVPICDDESEVRTCVPAPPASCESASDCEAGLVCVTYLYETCDAGPACNPPSAPGEEPDCAPRNEPAQCETESVGYCLPPYLAPCDAAADCGPGFECKAQEMCSCSGSGPTIPGGGDAGQPPEPECSCEPTGQMYCELIKQACERDSDCAGDMACRSVPAPPADSTCASTPDGGTSCEEPTGNDDPGEAGGSYCLPADLDRWIGGWDPGYDEQGSIETGGGAHGPGNNGSPIGSTVDRDNANPPSSGAASDFDASDRGCGCASSADAMPAPSSLAALALLGLGVLGMRRRR